MDLSTSSANLARVKALFKPYGAADANGTYLLCNRHDANAVADRIVDDHFQIKQMSFGERKRTDAAPAYRCQIHVVQTLPKTPSAKIKRFFLRQERAAHINIKVVDRAHP
jgi:hypothetical protein